MMWSPLVCHGCGHHSGAVITDLSITEMVIPDVDIDDLVVTDMVRESSLMLIWPSIRFTPDLHPIYTCFTRALHVLYT